jgi:hypothetical protein
VLTGKLSAHRRNPLGALLIALIERGDSEGGLRAHGSSRACCRWPEDAAHRAAAMAGRDRRRSAAGAARHPGTRKGEGEKHEREAMLEKEKGKGRGGPSWARDAAPSARCSGWGSGMESAGVRLPFE